MLDMLIARWSDMREIWERDTSAYPQPGPIEGRIGFWLRVKCSICILLNRKKQNSWDHVPVWISPGYVNYADPSMSWTEVGVGYGWRDWTYSRYRNGI